MSCDCNAVRGRHLEALAGVFAGKVSSVSAVVADLLAAYGDFSGATSVVGGKNGLVPAPKAGDNVKFLCGDGTWSTVPSGDVILDTVPATVNGGMWYEVENGTPIPKIYYNGQAYPLGGAVDPELTVTLTSSSVATIVSPVTATVNYNGDGNISVTASNKNVKPTYNSSTKTITVPYADVEGTITITVELSASTGFASARKTFTLTMEEIDPNLQVTPSANTVPVDGSITADISFKGSGTPTAKIGDTNLTVTNKKITIPYVSGVNSATVTVNLTASNGYTAATKSVTLSMATADPDLQVTPSASSVPVDGSITATVSYNGSGTISAKMGDTNLTYNKSTRKITIPYVADVDSVTITVNLTAAPGYKAATKSVTVSMELADPNLQIKLSASTIPVDGSVTATVTHNGSGALSAKRGNTALTVTDKKFTVSYVPDTDSVTITVNLTASPGYTAATKTVTVPMELADPGLSLSLDKAGSTFNAPATLSISFNGGGTPTAKMGDTDLPVTNNTATISYVTGADSVTVTVSLSAAPGYTAATETIEVPMIKANPQLKCTPTGQRVPYNGTAVIDVDYLSTGTISLELPSAPDMSGFTAEYNPSTRQITAPWFFHGEVGDPSATITVNLTADDNYKAASTTVRVSMEKADPHLTVTPSATVTVGDDITATVSYDDIDRPFYTGTIDSVTSNNVNVVPTYDSSTKTITVPYVANAGAVEIFVHLSEGSLYTEATYTFSVNMAGPPVVSVPQHQTFNGSQIYEKSISIPLGGQDFTISLWAAHEKDSNWGTGTFFTLYNDINKPGYSKSFFRAGASGNSTGWLNYYDTTGTQLVSMNHGGVMDFQGYGYMEYVYSHSTQTFFVFAAGRRKYYKSGVTLPRITYNYLQLGARRTVGLYGEGQSQYGEYLKGRIANFNIFDGVALHTENFTPPTCPYSY